MNYKNYMSYSIQKIFGSYSINIEKGNCTQSFYDVQEDIIDIIKYLEKENQELKEDISFCLHSIKQEMEMSTDSRTRNEMASCYEILKRWNK